MFTQHNLKMRAGITPQELIFMDFCLLAITNQCTPLSDKVFMRGRKRMKAQRHGLLRSCSSKKNSLGPGPTARWIWSCLSFAVGRFPPPLRPWPAKVFSHHRFPGRSPFVELCLPGRPDLLGPVVGWRYGWEGASPTGGNLRNWMPTDLYVFVADIFG